MAKNGQIFVVAEIVGKRQQLRFGPRFPLRRALAVHHRDVPQRVLRLLHRPFARHEFSHRESRLLHRVQRTRLFVVQKRVLHVPVHRKFHVYHRRRLVPRAPRPAKIPGLPRLPGLPGLAGISGLAGFGRFGGEESVESGFGLQFGADLGPQIANVPAPGASENGELGVLLVDLPLLFHLERKRGKGETMAMRSSTPVTRW